MLKKHNDNFYNFKWNSLEIRVSCEEKSEIWEGKVLNWDYEETEEDHVLFESTGSSMEDALRKITDFMALTIVLDI